MKKTDEILLNLLKLSSGSRPDVGVLCGVSADEWKAVADMSFDHGVAAVAVDGFLKAQEHSGAGGDADAGWADERLEWYGSAVMAEADYRYKLEKAASFAKVLAEKGIGCKVLKGFSFSTYHVRPEHRECGDCDVYLGDGFSAGNQTAVEMGGRCEQGTYKHSHIFLGRLMVENHRYLTDFNGTEQGRKTERLLEAVISESPGRQIGDSALICPNDRFNALFLLQHANVDFMAGGLVLRMLYDWAALLGRCQKTLDWKRMGEDLEECRLLRFAGAMTSMCVRYLGLEISVPGVPECSDAALVEEMMEDTLSGGIYTRGEESFLKKCLRICRRFRRIRHYRALATESVARMVWNSFAFSSYMGRRNPVLF